MKHDRRQEILLAAMELFAKKGFRGTTTRDLATEADVNEAIIFRHFNNKEELYTAILEHKVGEAEKAKFDEIERLAKGTNDEEFFMGLGRAFMEKHEKDTTFVRLLLFSALEGHQLSEMFVSSMAARKPFSNYIQKRIDEGAFRPVNPTLAARAFFGMFFSFVLWQEIFEFKKTQPFDREEVVRTIVSIFLRGMTKDGDSAPVSS
jgi:AcrR family transcriptional regulator